MSIKSKTFVFYASIKSQVFLGLAGHKLTSGNQRAGALKDLNIFLQKTTNEVNGEEHQKAVNIEKIIENGLIGFLKKSNNYFITTCKKKQLEDAQTKEIYLNCNDEDHQSILENPMAKNTGTFNEQSGKPLKLTIEKTSCRVKRNTTEQVLEISVHAEMTTTKRGLFQQKNSMINTFVVKSLLKCNSKQFCNTAIREIFDLKPKPQMKKLIPIIIATMFTNTRK